MEFISIPFVILLIVSFILFYLKANRTWQRIVLLLSSIAFIGYYHFVYLVVALCITLFTFYAGNLIRRYRDTKTASWLLTGSIVVLAGGWLAARYWSPLFPLGISFYTFQALSYLIEIYWDEEPEKDLFDFTLYMMLFMKFLSGPIERGFDLLPQLKKAHPFKYEQITYGMRYIALGVFMKLVIADRIGPYLDHILDDVHTASGIQLLESTLLYPIQLYADFAGYTNMAIGLGYMFGFKLQPNFNRPFVSLSTGELWRRWHMSLSFWVRDYVFVPLTATTRHWKSWGVYFSLLVTFVTIGVWHGAGWTFAIYGLIQGIIIIYETATQKFRDKMRKTIPNYIYVPLFIVRTYALFALSLLFFRIKKIEDVWYIFAHLLSGPAKTMHETDLRMPDNYWVSFGIAVLLMLVFEYFQSKRDWLADISKQKVWLRWSVYYAILILIFLWGAFGVENFIYIQF